jgi:hypothetical protein
MCLGGVKLRVDAPEPLLAVLDATMSTVPRFAPDELPDATISARRSGEVWEIRGLPGTHILMPATTPLPRVGGALVNCTMQAAATTRDVGALRATVIEKDGRALAMIGDDWESALTIAAHLHARGWRYIGGADALLDRRSLEVLPVQKSLYINSSSMRQLPVSYRRPLEASPWFVTSRGIAFYAVDPEKAGYGETWAQRATLVGVAVVDGEIADRPSIASLAPADLGSQRIARLGVDWTRVQGVDVRLGGYVETCDLLDHWFDSIDV